MLSPLSPKMQTPDLTFAIGDIHGCYAELVNLLNACKLAAGDCQARYVFLGDYIDRGPQSSEVVSLLRSAQAGTGEVICLKGNHERMLEDAVATGNTETWAWNGGLETIKSYGGWGIDDVWETHGDWFRALRLSFDDGKRFFVHAGVDPSQDNPLKDTPEHEMLWIRQPFLSWNGDFGRLVVHGHTPLRGDRWDLRPNRLNLDTGVVFGGKLTAAVFDDSQVPPIAFIQNDGKIFPGGG